MRHIQIKSAMPLLAAMLLFSAWGYSATDPAVDDYNFAAWLYNNRRYDVAIGAYEAFLKTHAGHEKVADARFGLAQSYFHLNRFDEAMPVFESLRQDHPDFGQMPEVLFQMGQTAAARQDLSGAAGWFSTMRSTAPEHYLADWALARQGACLLSLDRYEEAAGLLAPFVERYAPDRRRPPDRSDAVRKWTRRMEAAGVHARDAFLAVIERSLFYLGIANFNTANYSGAIEFLERFLALYPDSPLSMEAGFRRAQCLYQTGQFQKAAEGFEMAATGPSPFAATAAYERALALYKAGRLGEASKAMDAMANRFPDDPNAGRARLYAGTFRYEDGDFTGATERLRDASRPGAPLADEIAYWLGMCLLKGGNAAEAETVFSEALREHSKSPLAGDLQLGLADARLAQENMTGAAEAFTQYAGRFQDPETVPAALHSACVALHRAGRYREADARAADFLKRFNDHPQAVNVLFLSGENRFLDRQYQKAAERYREFLDRAPPHEDSRARAHFRLAWCHRYAERHDMALAEIEKADLKAVSREIATEALYLQGASLFDSQRYTDAIEHLNAYLKSAPDGRFADDAILKMSVAQARTGMMAQAVTGYEQFLKRFPESELTAQTRYQRAEGLYELKRYDEAADDYTAVLEQAQSPDLRPFARLGLGLCAYAREAWNEAAEQFAQLVRDHPDSELVPQAYYRQGQSLMKAGEWESAEIPLLALTDRYPKHELARAAWVALGTARQNRKAWERAADAFAKAEQSAPPSEDQPRLLYERAWSHHEAGQEPEALKTFQELADRFPKDPLTADARFHLAEARFKEAEAAGNPPDEHALRRYAEAAEHYRQVLDLTHDDRLADKALYRLGWCHWRRGEYAGAADAFDMLVSQFNESELAPDALFQSGQALLQAGQREAAMKRFGQLTGRRDADSFALLPEAYVALGEGRLAENQPKEALAPLRKAIETGGEGMSATRAYFLSGKAYYRQNRHDDAIDHFTTVTRRTRGALAAEAQFYIGQCEQSRERWQDAIVAYLRVQAIYGDDPEWVAGALLEMAKCHEALGADDEARRLYQDLVRTYPNTRWAPAARERLDPSRAE